MTDDPDIRRLTIEILTLADTLERDRAESVVEIGEKMLAVRSTLGRGEWGRWVADDVPYTKQSALNYMRLATWATEQSSAFVRFKSLGPTKLQEAPEVAPVEKLLRNGAQRMRGVLEVVDELVARRDFTEPFTPPLANSSISRPAGFR